MSGQLLRSRQWGDEYVIYNDLSGDTHLVDDVAMEILLNLQAASRNPAGVEFPGQSTCDMPGALDDLLASLASISLIERVAC